MTFSTITVVVIAANGLSAVAAATMLMLVLWQAPRQRMNQYFVFAMSMQLAYSISNGFGRFIDYLQLDPRQATYIAVMFFGLYVTSVFFFAAEFSEKRTPLLRGMRVLGVIVSLVVFFALWSDHLISDVYPSKENDGSFNASWTPYGLAVAVTIVVYLSVATVIFYRMDNARGRTMWPGPFFLVLGNVSNFILWPMFHLPLQSIFLAVAAVALGWPVLRFRLFDPLAWANQELARKNSELREAYQMKNQFLANVSHELRTPLNSIIGYTELVLNGTYGPLNETQGDRLEKVVRNGKNLLGLINDVLDLNRIETGRVTLEPGMVDTEAVLNRVADTIAPLASNKGLTVKRDYAGVPSIYADETRLAQIMINIAANAVKFTHKGSITIRARVTTDAVQFEVSDTGIGIAPDEFERVFNEFEQLDSSTTRLYEGTGLGMAITKRLVEMHGGRIWLESTVDVGSTFFVQLPARKPFELSPEAGTLDAPAEASVLVIDDSTEARLLLQDTLTSAGYTVATANSGLTGLARARELQPDLITLDVMMPGMDGWQVLRALKDDVRTRYIPVVIVSVVDNRPLAISLGASDAVSKPLDRNEMLHVLRQVLVPDPDPGQVLVVGQYATDCAMIRDILSEQGLGIMCVADGQAALEWMNKHVPRLVILDVIMPEISGFEVVTAMRRQARLAQTPVIVLAEKELSAEEHEFLKSRAAALVAKDDDNMDALLRVIRGARQQQPATTPRKALFGR